MKPAALSLVGGRVWDGLAGAAVRRDLFIADGLLVDAPVAGAETVDVSGATVVPGLIEGHAHLCFNAASDWRAVYDADSPATMLLRMAGNAQKMLRAGITTVRDLGAPTDLAVQLRDSLKTGLMDGPTLVVAGAPITTTGGHCYFMGGEADGELGIKRAVREHSRAGVDWIKVMATGGNMTPGTNTFVPQYSVDELRACIEDAHRLGLRVASHAHGLAGIRVAVEAGVDVIEHCSFTVPEGIQRDDALIEAIARKGIIVSPTISVGYRRWADDGRKAARADLTRAMVAAGCKIAMSTDCGIPGVPHEALPDALEVVREMTGLPPVEIIKLATSTSATHLGLDDRGVILPGKRADLLVVGGNPLEQLSALKQVRLVVAGGKAVS